MWRLIKKILIISLCILLISAGFIIYQGYSMYKNALEEISLKDKIVKILNIKQSEKQQEDVDFER